MVKYQFVTDTYRLYAALNRICNKSNRSYNNGPSQKFLLRHLKAMDYSLVGSDQSKTLYQERAGYSTHDAEGNVIVAKEMDVALIMLYGHILYTGTSYSYALSMSLP